MLKKAILGTIIADETFHSYFFLRLLRVFLRELRVKNELNSCRDWFNAEDGETDAEFAEHHALVKNSLMRNLV